MSIKHLGPTIGGGFFINGCASIAFKLITEAEFSPIWLQLFATSIGMVLGYWLSTKAQKEF
jgi:hypothetical protein